MFSSRNIVTVLLLIVAGGLGWTGGSHFTHADEAAEHHDHGARQPEAQASADRTPAGDDHDDEDAHAGHGHAGRPEPGAYCDEHRLFEAEDALCNPQLMTTLLPGEGVKMRLATPAAAERAGIALAPAQATHLASGAAVPAQATYNRARLAEVMALPGGVVRRIAAEPGQKVGKGALLAEIASPGAATARAEHQAALGRLELADANVRREQELVARGVSARIELEQALAEQQSARASVAQLRDQLAAFGVDPAAGGGAALLLRSPLAGTVVARNASVGQTLAPETPLFTVADLSSMWVELQVNSDRVGLARVGAAIEAEFDDLPGRRFPGKIVQVATGLDKRTRLLQVVAEIDNPDGAVKDGLFGQARLLAAEVAGVADRGRHHDGDDHDHDKDHGEDHGEDHDAVVAVPAAAVQSIDGKAYVFVAHEQDLFELRRIVAGPRRGGEVVISAGLNAGERVVASQGFALKSELLKSRLGATCADH
jgi:cobalt-zinc-cadmium efflux system membrane fusion protein